MIIVFGSINMDVIMNVPEFPRGGETILAPSYDMGPGGKGANQSLAAARTGVKTALVGKVGDDAMSHRILGNLRRNEVMTSGVAVSDMLPTGMAFVMLDRHGENQIIVASGANSDVSAGQVPDEILKAGNILLLQMEIPLTENFALLERAKTRGATTMLNLAPAFKITQQALDNIDYLIVNEHEARVVAEAFDIWEQNDMMIVAKALAAQGKLNCIVTLGSKGALAVTAQGEAWRVPAMKLEEIVDTTGAGDCFCGTFAAAIHEKMPIGQALRRAVAAACLSCTQKGAQDSYPFSADVEEALKNLPQAEKA